MIFNTDQYVGEQISDNENLAEMSIQYRKLFISVVIQAIKDYYEPEEKQDVLDWIDNRDGSFALCAMAMNTNPQALYELIRNKLQRMDKGEGIYIVSGNRFILHRPAQK